MHVMLVSLIINLAINSKNKQQTTQAREETPCKKKKNGKEQQLPKVKQSNKQPTNNTKQHITYHTSETPF